MSQLNTILNLAKTFNWHSPSWDLFIFLAWIVLAVGYAFAAGRGKAVGLFISICLGQLVVVHAPVLSGVVAGRAPSLANYATLLVFGIVTIVSLLTLNRFVFRSSVDGKEFSGILYTVVFGFLQVGLLVQTVLSYLPLAVQQSFHPLLRALFLTQYAGLVWLLLPLVCLVVVGRYMTERAEM
jgi:hypothetical protein